MKHKEVRSWVAFMCYAVLMVGCFIWATYKTTAPYEIFAWSFTGGFGAYITKRLMQKGKWFNDKEKEDLINAERN